MFSEIIVVVKDSEKRLTKKFASYDLYSVSRDDPFIKLCIEETLKDFGEKPDSVVVKIHLEVT